MRRHDFQSRNPHGCYGTKPSDRERFEKPAGQDHMEWRFHEFCLNAVTAAVCFGVFFWALQNGSVESARSTAFTGLVFCELLKSFSFRDETKPLWHLSLLANLQLPLVVAASFGLQLMLHHVEFLSRLLRTETPAWNERWSLLALGFIPLIVLELTKAWHRRHSVAAPGAQLD